MPRTFLEHKNPDGTVLVEHFEGDEVVGTTRIETAPSGTVIRREFDPQGVLTEEFHNHGKILGFAIIRKYRDGSPVEETYFRNRRLISRKSYVRHMADFPDMPAPTLGLYDLGADLQALVTRDQRRIGVARLAKASDPKRARELDEFCRNLMRKGDVQDAKSWIGNPRARLGERDRRASRALVEGICRHGATQVWACDIQTDPFGFTDTSHLVVRLPAEASTRSGLLKYLAKPARQQGLDGDPDDGQEYVYVKLA